MADARKIIGNGMKLTFVDESGEPLDSEPTLVLKAPYFHETFAISGTMNDREAEQFWYAVNPWAWLHEVGRPWREFRATCLSGATEKTRDPNRR